MCAELTHFISRPDRRAVVGLMLALVFTHAYEHAEPYATLPLNALAKYAAAPKSLNNMKN